MSLHKQLKNKEFDFESEYLFCTCSIATNLATSLDFNPIRCGTTLCHFGQTRKGSLATNSFPLSNTAMNSAAGGHVAVPERFGQIEDPASRNKERARNRHSCGPKPKLNDAQ